MLFKPGALFTPWIALMVAIPACSFGYVGHALDGRSETGGVNPSENCLKGKAARDLPEGNQHVILRIEERGGSLVLSARNLRPVAMELQIYRRSKPDELERTLILAPLSSQDLFEIDSDDRQSAAERIRERWRFAFNLGDPSQITPDEDYAYGLPWPKGKTYRLGQGFGGAFSHYDTISYYALDFQLKVGDPVHAARAGLVVSVVDWFCEQGGRSFQQRANKVVVQHSDGTFASYVHLSHGAVFVEEGEHVARGQRIGLSGVTGFTRGPHLHFVVRRERDIAIPIKFEGYEDRDLSRRSVFTAR